jgi:hypothetical protein
MKISHNTALGKSRYFASIYPKDRFTPYLEIKMSLKGASVLNNFEYGFLDLHYSLFDGFREIERVMITKTDFINQTFLYHLNTGDLISKIRIGLYFNEKNGIEGSLLISVIDISEPKNLISLNFPQLKESILFGPTIGFLEKLRSIEADNFQHLLDRDLGALEALIDEASGRTFNLWVLADTILKSSASSKLPLLYLDLAVERYYNEYHEGKKRLGFLTEH